MPKITKRVLKLSLNFLPVDAMNPFLDFIGVIDKIADLNSFHDLISSL